MRRGRVSLVAAVLVLVSSHVGPALADDGLFPPGIPFDPGTVVQFADSALALTDLDVLSGVVLADVGSAAGTGMDVVFQLNEVNALAFDAQRLAEQSRQDALARRRAEEERIAAQARASAANAQTEVGPDGCPVSVPPNTLRSGATEIGAHELCVASVASAATGEAAEAIKFTFVNLGVPYSRPNRMKEGFFDCSSYVMRAYQSAGVPTLNNGWAPSTHTLAPYPGYSSYPWLTSVPYGNARPGDLLLRPPSPTREDGGGHVAMLLASGYMIHTASTGDVSHVTRAYQESELFAVRRVAP